MKENNLKKSIDTARSPSYYARKRFLKNRPAFVSLILISLALLIAILGSLILPDKTTDANSQMIEIGIQPPGFSCLVYMKPLSSKPESSEFWETLIHGSPSGYDPVPINKYELKNGSLVLEKFTGDKSIKGDVETISVNELSNQNPESFITRRHFYLGSDPFGRDMLSRLLLGIRISVAVGFVAVIISLLVGIFMGAVSGFFRGSIEKVILWIMNVVWSIPTLLLVVALTFALGRGYWQIFVAVGLTMWVDVARMVRGQILSVREYEYVQAGRALGFKPHQIIIKHILPNIMGPVLVLAAANFASAILLESGLSFLGVGIQPPAPSLGNLLNDHYGYIVLNAAHLALTPGIAIMILVLAFNLLGNGLRDALDVKMS